MASNVSENDKKSSGKMCKWQDCPQSSFVFETIEEMLDHVKTEHIPTTIQNEDDDEEVVCQWENCETSTTRGDLKKKTEWMQNHFKTRHAKAAKTFKCVFEGCSVLKATSQEMETHVRLCHPVNPKKEKKTKPEPKPTKEPNRVWKIVDGDVVWVPPIIVTKKTIVHYDDGPRYVFPTGCPRCNYDSDESELASDESWTAVEHSDDEEEDDYMRYPPPGAQQLERIWSQMHPAPEKSRKKRRPRRMKRKSRNPQPSNEMIVSNVEEKEKTEKKETGDQENKDSALPKEAEKMPLENAKNNTVGRKRRSVRNSQEFEDVFSQRDEKPASKKKKTFQRI